MKSPKDTSWTKQLLLISVARGVAQRETPNPHSGGHKIFVGPGLQMHVFCIPVTHDDGLGPLFSVTFAESAQRI